MSAPRRPVIAGNWKMHKTIGESQAFLTALKSLIGPQPGPEVVVCPPFTAIAATAAAAAGSPIRIGGQTMDWHDKGAYTGEIAPGMLKDAGATHVVIGHSERRQYFAETDERVNLKTKAALANGLVPIVCVGETLAEREAGTTDQVVIRQTEAALKDLQGVAQLVFAYEPVWAIGTGKTCDSPEANRVCGVIRESIARVADPATADAVRVLYGGSVKPDTIAEQMAQPHIDGALVGGASLEAESFAAIVRYQGA